MHVRRLGRRVDCRHSPRSARRRSSGVLVLVTVTATGALGSTASPASAANEVSVALSPASPHVSEPTTLTFTGSSDRPARLHVTYISHVMAGGGEACSLEPS